MHGFDYTHLRKIIKIKKIVRFTTRKSVTHDFQACSSKNRSIYDTEISYA